MKKEDVYSREEQDFLDLVELLKEIRKDEDKIRKVQSDESIEGSFFNPLIQEYNKFKEAAKLPLPCFTVSREAKSRTI